EDETDPRLVGKVERRDDGLEVVAVGAEAVQPDDARLRVVPRLDLERVEEVGHRSTWGAPTWPPTPPHARSAPGNPWRSSTTRASLIGRPAPGGATRGRGAPTGRRARRARCRQ